MTQPLNLRERAAALKLHGLLAHWGEVSALPWAADLIDWEEQERSRRSLERRMRSARIGRFKPLADFDWSWPQKCEQHLIAALMELDFLDEATNVLLVGPSGVGKTTIAQNLAHQAVLHGRTVLMVSAGEMLGELAALDSALTLRNRLRHYASPDMLVIDEVGYLSYSQRHADILFELINRRHQRKSAVITSNRTFSEWHLAFPGQACVGAMVDRLIHNAEIISIQAQSWRLHEAKQRAQGRTRAAKPASNTGTRPRGAAAKAKTQ